MKKIILIIIFMTVLVGGAYYVGTQTNKETEYIETVIDLTDSEILQVEQDARLNWMPLDSAYALVDWALQQGGGVKWEIKDSTHWIFKDSINYLWNIKDSTAITYLPYYEAEDTIVNFDEMDSLKQIRVQLSLAIKPRFFPMYNKFLTDTQLRELTITQPERVDSWWKHRWVIYAGYGIGYSYQAGQHEHYDNGNYRTSSHTHEGWYHGFQAGIGFRLY